MNYAREAISRIAGYVPGEQPQGQPLIKLNTNENPYPPSPKVEEALREFDWRRLRLYSEPSAKMVREAAAKVYGVKAGQILCGNGSDDLLTIALRTFVGEGEKLAYTEPSYSLYPVLADLQHKVNPKQTGNITVRMKEVCNGKQGTFNAVNLGGTLFKHDLTFIRAIDIARTEHRLPTRSYASLWDNKVIPAIALHELRALGYRSFVDGDALVEQLFAIWRHLMHDDWASTMTTATQVGLSI